MFLKKIVLMVAIIFALMIANISATNAQDVWLSSNQNRDFYVMTDTFQTGVHKEGRLKGYRWFNVSVKIVENGKLIEQVKYTYEEVGTEWRYSHDKQRTPITWHVTRHNKLFLFCMHYLGWKYDDSIFWY